MISRRSWPGLLLLALGMVLARCTLPAQLVEALALLQLSSAAGIVGFTSLRGSGRDGRGVPSAPAETKHRRYAPTEAAAALSLQYPEAAHPATQADDAVASRVWASLCSASCKGKGQLLVERPPVRLLENVLDAEQAAEIAKSAFFDAGFGTARRERASIPAGPAAAHARRQVAAALGVEEALVEPLRLVRYSKPRHSFEKHVDWIVDAADPQLSLLGQRVATALIFLNDVPLGLGGETDFPALGLAVTPKLGRALLWPNVGRDGAPLVETLHEAKPLTEDGIEKVALNVWIRDRPLPTDPAVLAGLLLS